MRLDSRWLCVLLCACGGATATVPHEEQPARVKLVPEAAEATEPEQSRQSASEGAANPEQELADGPPANDQDNPQVVDEGTKRQSSGDSLGLNADFDGYSDLKSERHQVDLDGDGKVEEVLIKRAPSKATRLFINGKQTRVEGSHIQIVDLTPKSPSKRIAASGAEYDDDIVWIRIYPFADGKLGEHSQIVGNQHFTKVRKGVLQHDETNCGQRETKRWALRRGKLVQTSSKKTGKFNENLCAACPYVYVETEAGWQFVGEVLRNIKHPAMERSESMPLPSNLDRTRIRVKLSEEKRERTFLNRVILRAGGREILPGAVRTQLTHIDDNYAVIEEGDELIFEFRNVPSGSLRLEAHGYYIPLP